VFSVVAVVKVETLKKAVRKRGRSDELFAHLTRLLKEMEHNTHSKAAHQRLAVSKHPKESFLGAWRINSDGRCCEHKGCTV